MKRISAVWVCWLLLLGVGYPSLVVAAPVEAVESAPQTPAAAASEQTSARQQAGTLVTADELAWSGHELYASGDYLGAISAYERAYQLGKDPSLLFNQAQAFKKLMRCKDARSRFQRYLDQSERLAPEAAGWLDTLDRECQEPASAVAPVQPATPAGAVTEAGSQLVNGASPDNGSAQINSASLSKPAAPPRSSFTVSRVVGWSALAGGLGAAVAALLLDSKADKEQAGAISSIGNVSQGKATWSEAGTQHQRRAEDYGLAAKVCAGGAIGLLAAGSFLVLFEPFESAEGSVAVAATPNGAVFTWRKSL